MNIIEKIVGLVTQESRLKPNAIVTNGGSSKPFVILRDAQGNEKIHDLERLLPAPEDTRGKATLEDLDSFIQYVKERRVDESRIFAEMEDCRVTAILDFHDGFDPAWCHDLAVFQPEKTREWERWTKNDNLQIRQAQFAEFVEDNLGNIVNPAGAVLLEMARSLTAKKSVDFKSGINLENGDIQLQYEETTEAKAGIKGQLVIPSEITLALTPFAGAPAYEVAARLRYRIDEGKLFFHYKLRTPEKIWEDAVKDAVTKIGTETGVNVFLGSYHRGLPA